MRVSRFCTHNSYTNRLQTLTLVSKNVIVLQMNISSSQWREREQCVVKIINDVEIILKNPKVQKVLGANALALYGISQTIFLPNVRNGVISIPKEYRDSDLIPMMSLKSDEELRADESLAAMSMSQRDFMQKRLQEWHDEYTGAFFAEPPENVEVLDKGLMEVYGHQAGASINIKGANGRLIMASTAAHKIKNGTAAHVLFGRPLVVIDNNVLHVENEAAGIALHEFEHVRQFLEHPIIQTLKRQYEVQRLEQELRATKVQAEVGSAVGVPAFRMVGSVVFRTTMGSAMEVEDYRKRSVRFGNEYRYFDKEDEEILLAITGAASPVEQGIEAS
jgi:hypothetical protein